MRESDLSAPVSDWLRGRGFEVYSEVPIDHWTADLVGVRKPEGDLRRLIVVELKRSLTGIVARQASRSFPFVHEAWVAVATEPSRRGRGWYMCEKLGLGVLSLKTGTARRIQGAELHEPYRELNFRSLTPGGLGGLTNAERTPAQDVNRAIVAYVTDHPEATWTDIYHVVPNHYAHVKSLRQHHNTTAVRRARKATQ